MLYLLVDFLGALNHDLSLPENTFFSGGIFLLPQL